MERHSRRGRKLAMVATVAMVVVWASGQGGRVLAAGLLTLMLVTVVALLALRVVIRALTRPVSGLDLLIGAYVWRRIERRRQRREPMATVWRPGPVNYPPPPGPRLG
ncbi:MAG TPA: hypothetical protein VMV14_01255 [Acidimicrobiales bacterium]|nr:hypothetical protein [Acidimicrobiales bacterium]